MSETDDKKGVETAVNARLGADVAAGYDDDSAIPAGTLDPIYEAKARVLNRAVGISDAGYGYPADGVLDSGYRDGMVGEPRRSALSPSNGSQVSMAAFYRHWVLLPLVVVTAILTSYQLRMGY